MRVILCGANDISSVSLAFQDTVREMGFVPVHFRDATLHKANYVGWQAISKESVTKADLIVFVILNLMGEITWQTEYETAWVNRKPFMIFCLKETHDRYYFDKDDPDVNIRPDSNRAKLYAVLNTLNSKKRQEVIIPFSDPYTFKDSLKYHLVEKIEEAMEVLEKHYQDKSNQDFTSYSSEMDEEKLKSLLFNTKAKKEDRKNALRSASDKKLLSLKEIIKLVHDNEQGIKRLVVVLLPTLLVKTNDNRGVVKSIIEQYKIDDDVYIPRKLLVAVFQFDLEFALNNLHLLFPTKDEGTAMRVLDWMDENFVSFIDLLKNETNLKNFIDLFELAYAYDPNNNIFQAKYKSIKNKLENNK